MVDGGLGAAAVVLADCVEVSSPSPGNSRAVWELREEGALIETVLPIAGPDVITDPLTVGLVVVVDPLVVDPVVVTDDDVAVDAEVDDSGDTPKGLDPTAMLPPFVWPSAAVWAWAVVMPRRTTAIRIVHCIALSCMDKRRRKPRRSLAMQDNARSIENENEVCERFGWSLVRSISRNVPATNAFRHYCAKQRASGAQSPMKCDCVSRWSHCRCCCLQRQTLRKNQTPPGAT